MVISISPVTENAVLRGHSRHLILDNARSTVLMNVASLNGIVGTLIVTYLSDGKRVYSHTGIGRITDGNREFIGAVSNRGSCYIFTTKNSQTMIPAY